MQMLTTNLHADGSSYVFHHTLMVEKLYDLQRKESISSPGRDVVLELNSVSFRSEGHWQLLPPVRDHSVPGLPMATAGSRSLLISLQIYNVQSKRTIHHLTTKSKTPRPSTASDTHNAPTQTSSSFWSRSLCAWPVITFPATFAELAQQAWSLAFHSIRVHYSRIPARPPDFQWSVK